VQNRNYNTKDWSTTRRFKEKMGLNKLSRPTTANQTTLISIACTCVLLAALISCGTAVTPPTAPAAGTVGFALEGLRQTLDQTIQSAMNAGDFLAARSLAQIKLAIEAWATANESLLDKAANKVDQQRIRIIGDLDKVLKGFSLDTKRNLEQATRLGELLLQSVESMPTQPGRIYITRYSPAIVPPLPATEYFTLGVRGINLDDAVAEAELAGRKLNLSVVTKNDILIQVPKDLLASDKSRITEAFVKLSLTNAKKGGLWSRLYGEKQKRDYNIALIVLPEIAGHVTGSISVEEKSRVEEEYHTGYAHRQGRRTRITVSFPPKTGYRWDLRRVSVEQGKGEAGSCLLDLGSSNEESVVVHFTLNAVTYFRLHGLIPKARFDANAWVECAVRGTVYRDVDATRELAIEEKPLSWSADLVVVESELPISKFQLKVRDVSGRTEVHVGPARSNYYDVLTTDRSILIKPRPERLGEL
jgi:hypothetical protein